MVDLTEMCGRVVEALVAAPVAWQSAAELARATGLDVEETTDLLAALDANGWLAAWERQADVVVTLSVVAASRLGVRLVEFGPNEVPRWARPGDPEPPPPKAAGVFRGERASALGLVVDPAIAVELAAERAEEAALRRAHAPGPRGAPAVDRLPKPTGLLGTGLTPWPGPAQARRAAACPSCRSGPLAASSYCLYCDRWGLDHLLLDIPSPPRAAGRDRRDDVRRRDLERLARKEKRRAQRTHRAEAERRLRSKGRPRSPHPEAGPTAGLAAPGHAVPFAAMPHPPTFRGLAAS